MCPGAITQNSRKKVAFFELNKVHLPTRRLTRNPRVTKMRVKTSSFDREMSWQQERHFGDIHGIFSAKISWVVVFCAEESNTRGMGDVFTMCQHCFFYLTLFQIDTLSNMQVKKC